MTTLTTIDTTNYEMMAAMMGVNPQQKAKASTLPRLRIWNQGVKTKDGKRSVEVVPAGFYRLEVPDQAMYFAETVTIRPFMQRYMYKRYDASTNSFSKTLMHENLDVDLKDTNGGFNCGKPAGYIKDFNALSDDMKETIKAIRRVRVILGEIEMNNPIDESGEAVVIDTMPFIWEIDNKTAFKSMGEPFVQMGRQRKLPIEHKIKLDTSEQELQNGGAFFLPEPKLDLTEKFEINDADQQRFSDFLEWIKSYNEYVMGAWEEKRGQRSSEDEDALMATVADDVFIDVEDDAAA